MSRRGHVVFVDDNEATRYAVSRILAGAGYAVTAAETGRAGLERVRTEQPDVVLLDIGLPDMSGFEVVRRLKGDATTRPIPVVHLSAMSVSAAEQAQGLEGGADAYLTHPIEPRVLVATLDALLRARRAEAALRDANQRKDDFLAVLSHELRNPLAPIRNAIALLDRAPPGSDPAARAKQILARQTEHLTRLVSDLLDVTRIERGKVELRRTRLDLQELVRRTCEDLRSTFDQARVALRLAGGAGPLWIEADPTRIAQVISNLLQNAAKFTPAAGTVTVSVEAGEATAEVRVHDSGIGIEPEQVMGMFEPFAQADRSLARTNGGLGLGLALVRGLVELHGGDVTARSEGLGRGAEFTIRLPRATAPAASPPPPPLAPRAAARRARVLIVEDNADAAQSLEDLLALLGHEVWTAPDGATGIARARALRPDVVLCDIGLPDMDGYAVARALRAPGDPLAGTHLVALSGYAQPEDQERAREAGFERHVPKPPQPEQLDELLGRLVVGEG
jgi:signal transduction histidine kinase